MSKFADYTPGPTRSTHVALPEHLEIRMATLPDAHEIAVMTADREGYSPEKWLPLVTQGIERSLEGQSLVLVACVDGDVGGYGRASYFTPPVGSTPDTAPEGWYLTGLVVKPAYQRRGVGSALTRARLEWIRERSTQAFYFANTNNLATIDLHKEFGFRELTRNFTYPNAVFEGGAGVLFICDLPSFADSAERS